MSNHSGIRQVFALVGQLRDLARDFAAREEKLSADFRARTGAETKAFETASTAQAARAAEELSQAETGFRQRHERLRRHFELRKKRINQAHIASRARAMDAIRDNEGRSKYKVQEGTLNAERRRDAELSAASARFDEFSSTLASESIQLRELELRALASLGGYSSQLRRELDPATRASSSSSSHPESSQDEAGLLVELQKDHEQIEKEIASFRKRLPAGVGKHLPLWISFLLMSAGIALLVPPVQSALGPEFPSRIIGAALVGIAVIVATIRLAGQRQAVPAAGKLGRLIAHARELHEAADAQNRGHLALDQQRAAAGFEEAKRQINQDWKRAVKESINLLDARPREIDEQAARAAATLDRIQRERLAGSESEQPRALSAMRERLDTESRAASERHAANFSKISEEHRSRLDALAAEWTERVTPLFEKVRTAQADAEKAFPDWRSPGWTTWTPPEQFEDAARMGTLDVDFAQLAPALPTDPRFAFPGSNRFSVPLLLTYPDEGSILFETANGGAKEALQSINNIIFRLLSVTPPGKLSFTIFDPVGLGQNFAGLMHLADYEESHINSRIWTQTAQLEEKLAELNEHMEKVIQMYLRNEFTTIAEYNAQAGVIAEKYHFLVIADFPVNFSDTAARRLLNIVTSGARCGVYTLIHWDRRQPLPAGFVAEDLRKNSVNVNHPDKDFSVAGQPAGTRLRLDPPPSPEFATGFLHTIGESSKGSNRVEVPFEQVTPSAEELWSEETTEELRVPIGRSGASKLQYLELGRGTRQHALIAGKTGSGKSTLFHVMITNLALWCSPEQVEFYLVDFKKGVEFKCYATRRLPHARVVAIESDRQFGLSVLQRVDDELRRRGDLFRKLGVQDVAGYKRAGGKESIPRSLLMIDEFQEFFTEEDRVSQGAAVLLDRIVRQGRAFGIHVILGSQTLGGAYTLARATMGQMVVRIALQCNEADAYLIMDQDNPAPRLLSRPGEGIYNDAAGAIEGNSPFQAVWISEESRDQHLDLVRARADQFGQRYPGPFVFEGNAPANVRDNEMLAALFDARPSQIPAQPHVWLGAPNAVKGPTETRFHRQSGSNLLIVGQAEEPALGIVSLALLGLAAQYPPGSARFVILDSTPPGIPQREYLERIGRALPHEVLQVRNADLGEKMNALGEDLARRTGAEHADTGMETFLVIHGLQNFKKLRQEDEFSFSETDSASPAAVLQKLITEGPGTGFHVIATCDTYTNLVRFLGRKTLGEFETRILFQMSASDSASLIDDPGASTLGLNRAIFYNDREGYLETFRPYALPDAGWVEEASRRIAAAQKS